MRLESLFRNDKTKKAPIGVKSKRLCAFYASTFTQPEGRGAEGSHGRRRASSLRFTA